MSDRPPDIYIELRDGTGCYAVAVPVDSRTADHVAVAANTASALLIRNYVRDRALYGPWDPEAHMREFYGTPAKEPA